MDMDNNLQQNIEKNEQVQINTNMQEQESHNLFEKLAYGSESVQDARKNLADVQNNKDVWKYDKKVKKAKKKLEEEKEKDRISKSGFTSEMETRVGNVQEKLAGLGNSYQKNLEEVIDVMAECTADSEYGFEVDRLLMNDEDMTTRFLEFKELFQEMRGESPFAIKQERMKELVDKYQKLQLNVESPSSKFLRDETRDGMSFDAMSLMDTSSAYFLLYNCIVVGLRNYINGLDEQKVNIEEFGKLCGVVMSSTLVANTIYNNQEFLSNREAKIKEQIDEKERERVRKEEEERQKAEAQKAQALKEEKERLEALKQNNKSLLEELIKKHRLTAEWFKPMLLSFIETNHEDILYKEKNSTEPGIVFAFNKILKNINQRIADIGNELDKHPELIQDMPQLKRYLAEKIAMGQGTALSGTDSFSLSEEKIAELKSDDKVLLCISRKEEMMNAVPEIRNYQQMWGNDIWADQEIQTLILDQTVDFQAKMKLIQEQASQNSSRIKQVIAKRILPINQEYAYDKVMEYLGVNGLFSAPSILEKNVNSFLSNKNIVSESLLIRETRIRHVMKKLRLEKNPEEVCSFLRNSVEFDEERTEKDYIKILSTLRDRLLVNQEKFDKVIANKLWTKEQWERAYQWCKEHEMEENDRFNTMMQAELEKAEFQRALSMGIEKETYLYGAKSEAVKTNKEGYLEKIKGELLCNWTDFNGSFQKDEEILMRALNELVMNQAFTEDFPFMKKVKNFEQLENLTYVEFSEWMDALRMNLMAHLDMWQNLEGLHTAELKVRVMPAMMQGKLTTKELTALIEEENQKLVQDFEYHDMLFHVLIHNSQEERKDIDYQLLAGHNQQKNYMPDARAEKFEYANLFWSWAQRVRTLRMELVDLFIAFRNEFEKNLKVGETQEKIVKKYEQEIVTFAKELESFLESDDKKYEKYKYGQLFHILGEVSQKNLLDCMNQVVDENNYIIRISDYLKEVMLFGSEMNLLGSSGQGAMVFAAGTDKEYNQFLYDKNWMITLRTKSVFQKLKEEGYSAEEMNQLMDKMHPVIVGMEPVDTIHTELTQQMRENNLRKFGKASFEEAIKCLSRNNLTQQEVEKQETWNKATKLYDKRVSRLKEDSLLSTITPYLLQETAFLKNIMTLDDVSFEGYVQELKEGNVGRAMKSTKGEAMDFFKKQFVIENLDKMLSGELKSQEEWWAEYSRFEKAIANKKIRSKTIPERIIAAVNGDMTWYWKLDYILQENPTQIKALFATDKLKALINKYAKIEEANMKVLNECQAYKRIKKENNAYAEQFIVGRQKELLTMPTDLFKMSVENMVLEYEARISAVTISIDHHELIQNAKFCKELELRKQAGAESRSEQTDFINKWHSQMWKQASPYQALAQNEEVLTKTTIATAKKDIREKFWDYSQLVQNLLVERKLSNKKIDEVNLRQNAIFLERAWEKVQKMTQDPQSGMTMEQAQQFMVFLDLWAEERPNSEVELDKIITQMQEKFTQRQEKIDNLSVIFRDERLARYQNQIKDTMDGLLNMGRYTMEDDVFESFIEKEYTYWMAMYTAIQLIEQKVALEVDKNNVEEKNTLVLSFMDYLSKEIAEGTYMDAILKISDIIKDKEFLKFMKHPESRIGKVSWDEQRDDTGIVTHEDVMKLLADSKDEDIIQSYNALNLEERQIFALTLMITGRISENENLPTVAYIRGEVETEKEEENNDPIKEQIQNYVNHKAFAPQIVYSKVLANLKSDDNTLNKEVFEETLAFTNLCKMQYQQNIPKDWTRIKDGTSAIEVAKLGAQMGARVNMTLKENVSQINGTDSFTEVFKKVIEEDKNSKKSLPCYERLQTLLQNGENLPMLIMMLQDRTVLDYTTGVNFIDRANGIVHTHVNEEGRKVISDIWVNMDETKQDLFINANQPEFCQKAFTSLLSYQLRDDISFLERAISKEDFASGAYDRDTILDWTLIERAFDLMDEVETEILRRKAVQEAPKNIERTSNEAAIEQYRKYVTEFEKNRSEKREFGDTFENFLKENLEKNCEDNDNPEVAALMAGYKDLDENQKALFVQVLQRRDFLDVSKVGDLLSHFGLAERDYVNPAGRDELTNEYIRKTLSSKAKLTIKNEQYENAVYSLLSTQIDDSVDFVAMREKEKGLSSAVEKKFLYFDSRKTAVDWKLFRRALQFVHRATNERDIVVQDQELYLSQSEIGGDALFDIDAKFLRKNLHKSGNRASRFVGKRLLKHFISKFPARLQRMALLVLPIETANQINSIDEFKREDGKVTDIVSEVVSGVNDALVSFVEEKAEKLDNEDIKSGISDILEMYTEKAEDMLAQASYDEEMRLADKNGVDIFEKEEILKKQKETEKKRLEEREKEKQKGEEEQKESEEENEKESAEGEEEKQEESAEGEEENQEESEEENEEENEEEVEEKYVNYQHELTELLKDKGVDNLSALDYTSVTVNEIGRQVKKFDGFVNALNEKSDQINEIIENGSEYVQKGLSFIQNDEIQGYLDIGSQMAVDYKLMSQEQKDNIMNGVNKFVGKLHESGLESGVEKTLELAEDVKEVIEDFQECLTMATKVTKIVTGVVDTTKKVVSTLQNKEQLDQAQVKAQEAREQDELRKQRAAERQTEEERSYAELAMQRNRKANAVVTDVTHANLNDEIAKTIIDYSSDLIGTYANESTVGVNVKSIMTEATELIFFFRNLYKDNEMLKLYFDENQKEAKRIREGFVNMDSKVDYNILTKFSNMQLIQHAKGFENFTELAEYVGRNLVQALLFCASQFNPQVETRIQSVAVLKILGEEKSINKYDSETAERIFTKLFNQDYR